MKIATLRRAARAGEGLFRDSAWRRAARAFTRSRSRRRFFIVDL